MMREMRPVTVADATLCLSSRSSPPRTSLTYTPLFVSFSLDTLPVYSLTHAIRIIVSARTETTLTWDQLRSPQVSQFLIKPMQQQIRNQHFSRATLYALMANCLQFTKEGQLYAANAGTSNTRAKVCELLALKLLKEYSTRELIDALAYDFYPLQGLPGAQPPPMTAGSSSSKSKNSPLVASRTSTLEVAIRASAKHFLAHPVVVQQLEAIWNGAISFYSSADSLHRESPSSPFSRFNSQPKVDDRTPLLGSLPPKQGDFAVPPGRRTVMLYDPRQASLLKLSRLRVPRYRSFLSTLSLAVLIGLFLAVLAKRSAQITGLELVFWFWSAGFMLDELVGFNEQGFALYIMSFWNIFDLGILVLLIAYYCMRVYGVFLADPHHWNAMAYDVLAANAILLLPRIFSILDHYQYFSQLLIAFRLMAVDLAAVCVLILIVCSGFYVFFTSSTTSSDGGEVAYKIFQIIMGFTPAAWDVWPSYNWLARALLCFFLIICHFLIVTILITVLTNSFMKIASNATEEHQFLFAINTISMVKNDALFSYIAPSNIFAWVLMPLRYCMPLRHFVLLNRIIIKVTHCPVLFCIYLYERLWLAPSMYEPTDLVENPGRSRTRAISFGDMANRTSIFSPSMRVREESVAGYQKDRALDELFLRMPDATRTQRTHERRKAQTAIRNWMDRNDQEGAAANWPPADGRAVPDWQRRMSMGWDLRSSSRQVSDIRSIVSDPADLASNAGGISYRGFRMMDPRFMDPRFAHLMPEYKDHTDADGDDELVTNDEDEDDLGTSADPNGPTGSNALASETDDYFTTTPTGARSAVIASSHSSSDKGNASKKPRGRGTHNRTLSTTTILFNPGEMGAPPESSPSVSPPKAPVPTSRGGHAGEMGGAEPFMQSGMRSPPRRSVFSPPSLNTRSTMPTHGLAGTSNSSRAAILGLDPRSRDRAVRRLSSADLSILSDNTNLPFGGDINTALAGSFQTQMAMAMMKDNRLRAVTGADTADRDRMGRLVLARMKTLEESFADVIKEMRDMKNSSTAPTTRRNSSGEELRMTSDRPKSRKGTATPKKAPNKRPVSRRSMKESKLGLTMTSDVKGKGKYIAYSPDEEGEGAGNAFLDKGSSL
ncbi:integral membrane channel [Trichoderma arundinaceum]|uniref:Integral membrane channel n=1 Tax=Trichoderma arundinaceum TaxID=490622 RepID=A0A395N746_TRIAR|nr:integral membrane channel [Trichoderma arundinaceum]